MYLHLTLNSVKCNEMSCGTSHLLEPKIFFLGIFSNNNTVSLSPPLYENAEVSVFNLPLPRYSSLMPIEGHLRQN